MPVFSNRWRVALAAALVGLGAYALSRWLMVTPATSAHLMRLPPFSQASVSGVVLAEAVRAGDRALWPVRDAAGVFTLTLPLTSTALWPAPGDVITAQGWVEGRAVQVTDLTTLTRQPAPAVRAHIAALRPQLAEHTVTVRGWVATALESEMNTPQSALTLFITDSAGALTVALPASARAWQGTAWPPVQPGDEVEVTGRVDFFAEPPVLRVARLEALTLRPAPLTGTLADTPLGANGAFTLAVQAVEVRRFNVLVLAVEANTPVEITVPLEVWQASPVRPGGQVQVQGELDWQAGQRALRIRAPADWRVRTVGPLPAQPTPIRDLGLAQVGQWVTVRGWVHASAPLEGGTRLTVRDDAGLLTVALWGTAPAPPVSAPVVVTGPLGVFGGELQLTAAETGR